MYESIKIVRLIEKMRDILNLLPLIGGMKRVFCVCVSSEIPTIKNYINQCNVFELPTQNYIIQVNQLSWHSLCHGVFLFCQIFQYQKANLPEALRVLSWLFTFSQNKFYAPFLLWYQCHNRCMFVFSVEDGYIFAKVEY